MTGDEFLKMFDAKESDTKTLTGVGALAAVKQDGGALRFVKTQTPEVCLEAVKQDRDALQYVDLDVFREENAVAGGNFPLLTRPAIEDRWNAQADIYNQWETLRPAEKTDFAYRCGVEDCIKIAERGTNGEKKQ
jgi:hypothetical protein